MESHKKNLINNIKSNLSKYGSCSSDFDLNPDMAFNQNSNFLEASVLIPVLTFKKNLEILLTKRSTDLENHPGQIAFQGGKKENFDIQLDKDVLSISIKEETESEGEKGQYTRREFKQREFEQHFTLDLGSLDVENISASYEGGILRLEIPKKAVEAEEETKRRIQIQ